jgi:integrase
VTYGVYLDSYVNPHIGDTRLSDLTPVRLNLLYGHLLTRGRIKGPGGLSPKTVVKVHRMLHQALRDAVKWDYLPRNAADGADPPRPIPNRPRIWDPEQLLTFVEHVRNDRFYALWLLVVTTGFRRGELAGLRHEDIDLEYARVSPVVPRVVVDGKVQESATKTSSGERWIAIDPITVEAMRKYLATWREERRLLGQDGRLLFVWPNGRPLHPDTITALFHQHCAAAGLPRIRLHDVRHSYATAALKAGVPAKIVSERLGHATAAFTLQVYSHVIPGMDQQAANTVAALIWEAAPTRETPDVLTSVLEQGQRRERGGTAVGASRHFFPSGRVDVLNALGLKKVMAREKSRRAMIVDHGPDLRFL